MTDRNQYIENLNRKDNWIDYLKENSGLPGKRAKLEILKIATDLGDEHFFMSCLKFNEKIAPTNTPGEFVAICGVAGLGKLVNKGKLDNFNSLRKFANDSRWRVREGVAFGLQIIGKRNFDKLICGIQEWINGNDYEKRAVVAGLCEPGLLKDRDNAKKVLEILNEIIESVKFISDRTSESFRVLKKSLGYGLSVAIVSYPEIGENIFEKARLLHDKQVTIIGPYSMFLKGE